jgi:hypothetical protein
MVAVNTVNENNSADDGSEGIKHFVESFDRRFITEAEEDLPARIAGNGLAISIGEGNPMVGEAHRVRLYHQRMKPLGFSGVVG